MPPNACEEISRTIETLYRSESGRIAIQLVSQLPGFKYGLGPIEIRPVADLNEMMKKSEQRRRKKAAG